MNVDIIKNLNEATDALRSRLLHVQSLSNQSEDAEHAMRNEVEALLKDRENELECTHKTEEDHREKLKNAENTVSALNSKMAEMADSQSKQQHENDRKAMEMKNEMAALRRQNQDLKQEMDRKQKESEAIHGESQKKAKDQNEEFEETEKKLESLRSSWNGLHQNMRRSTTLQQSAESERDALLNENEGLKEELKEQQSRKRHIIDKLEQTTLALRASESERNELIDATNKELSRIDLLQRQCDGLEHTLHENQEHQETTKHGLEQLKTSMTDHE